MCLRGRGGCAVVPQLLRPARGPFPPWERDPRVQEQSSLSAKPSSLSSRGRPAATPLLQPGASVLGGGGGREAGPPRAGEQCPRGRWGGRDQRPLQAPRRTTAARLGTASGVRGPLSKGTSRLPLTWASIPSLGVTRAFPEPVCVPAWRWGSTCQDNTWGGSGRKMLEKALRSGKEPEVLFQAALSP